MNDLIGLFSTSDFQHMKCCGFCCSQTVTRCSRAEQDPAKLGLQSGLIPVATLESNCRMVGLFWLSLDGLTEIKLTAVSTVHTRDCRAPGRERRKEMTSLAMDSFGALRENQSPVNSCLPPPPLQASPAPPFPRRTPWPPFPGPGLDFWCHKLWAVTSTQSWQHRLFLGTISFQKCYFFFEQWTSGHFSRSPGSGCPTHVAVSAGSSVHHVRAVLPQGICL